MESQPLQSSGHIVQTAADGRQIMEGQCIEIILLPAHSKSWSGSCIYTLYKWRSCRESPGQKSVWMLCIPSAAESADEYTHTHTQTCYKPESQNCGKDLLSSLCLDLFLTLKDFLNVCLMKRIFFYIFDHEI